MKSLYNDPTLGYSQTDQFDIPADFDPCHRDGYDFDDMETVSEDGEPVSDDFEIMEELFE